MTSADAQFFWANHPGGVAWLQKYAATASAPPREWALGAIRSFGHAPSVLDLGCHCGPLLYRLRQWPVDCLGIDINAEAVNVAQASGLPAIVGTVPDALRRLKSQSFDVVTSTYCLAYIAPGDLQATLYECLRVARLGLVIIEPTAGPGVEESELCEGRCYVEWRHDYVVALARAVEEGFPGRLRAEMSCESKVYVERPELNALVIARLQWPN